MEDIQKWLANIYSTNLSNIKDILKDEKATTYLLVWSVFEQKVFSGYMHECDILQKSDIYSKSYSKLNVDNIAKTFHNRYADKTKLKHLKHKNSNKDIDVIILKEFSKLTPKEKLQLLFYVSYRYRNNIFHGNKGVLSWTRYSEQINDCISFMMAIVNESVKQSNITQES